jgi:hypothetical protein
MMIRLSCLIGELSSCALAPPAPRSAAARQLVKSISSSFLSNKLFTREQQRAAAWRPGTRLVLRGHEEAGVVEEAELLLWTRHPLRLGERGEGRDVSG